MLSEAEKIELEQWYNRQDRIESTLLNLPDPTPETLRILQEQVDSALAQLLTVTQRIQALAAENDSLRREITALSSQLAHTGLILSSHQY